MKPGAVDSAIAVSVNSSSRQRQRTWDCLALGPNLGAGKSLRKKNLSAGAPFSLGPVAGPTPPYRQHTDHPGPDDQLADDQHTDDPRAEHAATQH